MKKVEKLAQEIRNKLNGWNTTFYCDQIKRELKEIIEKHAPIDKPFPKTMVLNNDTYQGLICFFEKKGVGIIIESGNYYEKRGYKFDSYSIEDFKDSEFKDCEIEIKPCT